MNREDIIRMAREAGCIEPAIPDWVIRTCALVASAEREACAKVCANLMTPWDENTPNHGAVSLVNDGMRQCAAAIRARGQA